MYFFCRVVQFVNVKAEKRSGLGTCYEYLALCAVIIGHMHTSVVHNIVRSTSRDKRFAP